MCDYLLVKSPSKVKNIVIYPTRGGEFPTLPIKIKIFSSRIIVVHMHK